MEASQQPHTKHLQNLAAGEYTPVNVPLLQSFCVTEKEFS